jgi:hypothetical protein
LQRTSVDVPLGTERLILTTAWIGIQTHAAVETAAFFRIAVVELSAYA